MLLSGMVIAIFLALADKLPLFAETEVALKRVIIGLMPASMSTTLLDSFK